MKKRRKGEKLKRMKTGAGNLRHNIFLSVKIVKFVLLTSFIHCLEGRSLRTRRRSWMLKERKSNGSVMKNARELRKKIARREVVPSPQLMQKQRRERSL